MHAVRAHHRALPHVRLFPRRRRWLVPSAAVASVIAISVPAIVLTGTAPRSATATGGTAVLTAVTRPDAAQTASAYRIRPGDTLSGIAARLCGDSSDYTGLAAANGIRNPDFILAGATLYRIRCYHAAIAIPRSYRSTYVPYRHHRYRVAYAPQSSYRGSPGCQARIIAHESGGNSQVMNSSGHYGLYQFSSSTWAAYGGSSSDFGHASVSEQNRVFNNALAAGGRSNWTSYDGC